MEREATKDKIRPLYSEFQGYLSQTPKLRDARDIVDDSDWMRYNEVVKELNQIAGENYNKFLIKPEILNDHTIVLVSTYRQTLGGLISRLHAEYFSDEPAPFSGMPSTIITQTQQQSQSIQMYLDIQSKIDEAIPNFEDGSKEKGFLEKFKSSLNTASNVNDLFKLCFKLATELGVSIATLLKIFS